MKRLVILGGSGSIGSQTLDIVQNDPKSFTLIGLSLRNRNDVSEIIAKFPTLQVVLLSNEAALPQLEKLFPNIHFILEKNYASPLVELIKLTQPEMVVNAVSGFAGLAPTLYTLEVNKILCLANKESLVVGGELVGKLISEGHGVLYPIDSEHVALSKCMKGQNPKEILLLILTASGGALRDVPRTELANVTVEDVLKHPSWSMGKKITVDSATMVNKAFEIVEAFYLYNLPPLKIKVVQHEQSLVHSMVKFFDGSYLADISYPDMKIPIMYALYETKRVFNTTSVNIFHDPLIMSFKPLDVTRFPMLKYGYDIIKGQGNLGAIFNAASEVAANAFLEGKISFISIEKVIKTIFNSMVYKKNISYEILSQTDAETRTAALNLISQGGL
jgi:1-deoxy-D-xylulose-5-phosphate reductoisomerase